MTSFRHSRTQLILATLVIPGILLSGCGQPSPSTNTSGSYEEEASGSESGEWVYKEPEIRGLTVGEIFRSDERQVWYDIYDPIGKDAVVYNIYVVENGEVTVYHGDCFSMSLGEAAMNGDEWAVETAIAGDAQAFEDYPDIHTSSIIGPTYASVVGHTDSTGNTVVSETVYIGDDLEFDINSSRIYTGQVFDSYYVGFDNASGTRPSYFITLDRGDTHYILDSRDSEYLDYWD